ncbi:MAG: hypothetical protein GEU83_00715 [Pseudonocardiaceae bacterium]|nr:hypothetical protein [Pseudonocardiaceae bacterium]
MSKKRYLAAFGAAGLVFAGVFGAAAALDVNNAGVAQSGESDQLSCDENGVRVVGYNLDTNGYRTARSFGVTVDGIANACDGKTLVVRTLDDGGNQLGFGFAEITDNRQSVRYSDAPRNGVPVEDIERVQLTIG